MPELSEIATDSITGAEAVFGPQSTLRLGEGLPTVTVQGSPLTDNITFHAITAALLVGYCLLVFFYRGSVWSLLKSAAGKLSGDKLISDQNNLFSQFLSTASVVGIFAVGVGTVKIIDMAVPGALLPGFPEWVYMLAGPAVMTAMLLVMLYRVLVLRIAGALTLSQGFTAGLLYLRRMIFATGTLTLTPVILLLAVNPYPSAIYFRGALIVCAGLWLAYLISRTYIFFVEQKVSILHWFLYLCTVEIFPVSVLVLAFVRNF